MNNNIYNGPQAPYIPQPVTKVKEKPEYSKAEVVLSVFAFIAAFCAVRYILFNAMGFITTGVFIAIITAAIIYMKKKGCEFSAFNKVLAAVLYIFSFVFSITANNSSLMVQIILSYLIKLTNNSLLSSLLIYCPFLAGYA